MQRDRAAENLQVIRTLMERAAIYRRALGPVMLAAGLLGIVAGALGRFLQIESPRSFVLFWLATGVITVAFAFAFVRRQALKAEEPFWSMPTRRIAIALAPPFSVGLFAALSTFLSPQSSIPPVLLPVIWSVLYGCGLHSAGFFMVRGIKWLGWIFILCGLFLAGASLDIRTAHMMMGAIFGGLHLAYGVYLSFTEQRKNAA